MTAPFWVAGVFNNTLKISQHPFVTAKLAQREGGREKIYELRKGEGKRGKGGRGRTEDGLRWERETD